MDLGTVEVPEVNSVIQYDAPNVATPCASATTSFSLSSVVSSAAGGALNAVGAFSQNPATSSAFSSAGSALNFGGTVSLSTNCGDEIAGKKEVPKCDGMGDADLELEKQKIILGNQKAIQSLACRVGQSQALNNELACFSDMITNSQKELGKLQAAMAPLLTEATKELVQIDQDMKDRNAQVQEVDRRHAGMQRVQKLLQEKIHGNGTAASGSSSAADIARVNVSNYKAKQVQFETAKKEYELGLAMTCFLKEPVANFKCSPGGVDVSASEYLTCAGAAATQRNADGTVIQNGKLGEATRASLQAEFNRLEQSAPVMSDFPIENFIGAAGPTGAKRYAMRDQASVEKYFISRFSGMKRLKAGLSMDSAIRGELNRCYKKANRQVTSEMSDKGGSAKIAQTMMAIKTEGEGLQGKMRSDILKSSEIYRQVLVEATGNPDVKLNAEPCLKANMDSQTDCIQQMDTLMMSILDGKIASSNSKSISAAAASLSGGAAPVTGFFREITAPSEVKSGMKRLSFTMKCAGVNACVEAYANVKESLFKDGQRLEAGKKTYITNVNSAIQAKTQEISKALGNQAGFIRQRQTQLANLLGRLGVKGGIDLDSDEGNPDTDPGEGVFKNNQIADLIKGKIRPALFKSDSGIRSAREGLSDTMNADKEKIREYAAVMQRVTSEFNKCKLDELKDLKKELADQKKEVFTHCQSEKKDQKEFEHAKTACIKEASKAGESCRKTFTTMRNKMDQVSECKGKYPNDSCSTASEGFIGECEKVSDYDKCSAAVDSCKSNKGVSCGLTELNPELNAEKVCKKLSGDAADKCETTYTNAMDSLNTGVGDDPGSYDCDSVYTDLVGKMRELDETITNIKNSSSGSLND
jgi:hypothetical protein